ncbi:MAG: malate dehydrogenase [Candidatus Kerfeldbacteria bacterium]|nr:malate dehydrogenase [Candidatus Kerfeldbacteria bacterium]
MKTTAALRYHQHKPAGKLSIQPTKPCRSQRDLALAYTPGVAEPVLAIARQPAAAWQYTNRGNLVGVISNGTAVLGLGRVGALASKPVMEGKSVLFKRFADIDAYDIEVACTAADQLVDTIARLAPTFGGINLEDIAAPDCFTIETALQRRLDIPVFHDDQHGTAIVSGAALLNGLYITGKNIQNITVVINGAGAAGIRCAEHYVRLGVRRKNVTMFDRTGVIHHDRSNLNRYQKTFARVTQPRLTLAQALVGADVFLGVSVGNIVSPAMLKTMAARPIVLAMANPDPEISYQLAKQSRRDILVATGRSDCPNQVNNVLGFPFVFRGALDVRARRITTTMKIAATWALAQLARQPVPATVLQAYHLKQLRFGPDYLLPKPFDPRLLVVVSAAVAAAAINDGVAQHPVQLKQYRQHLTTLSHALNL